MKAESNCRVLGTGSKTEDFAHVTKSTPLDLKRREFANDPRYKTTFENGIDPKREAATTRARRAGNVRPL